MGGWVGGWSSQFLIPHLRPSYRMGLSSGPSVAKQKGECHCEHPCLIMMHHSTQTRMEICERDAAPGDIVPVNPMYFMGLNPKKLRLRDVPSLETHAMENHANYDNMDAVLYDNDPFIVPGGLFEQMTPFKRLS